LQNPAEKFHINEKLRLSDNFSENLPSLGKLNKLNTQGPFSEAKPSGKHFFMRDSLEGFFKKNTNAELKLPKISLPKIPEKFPSKNVARDLFGETIESDGDSSEEFRSQFDLKSQKSQKSQKSENFPKAGNPFINPKNPKNSRIAKRAGSMSVTLSPLFGPEGQCEMSLKYGNNLDVMKRIDIGARKKL